MRLLNRTTRNLSLTDEGRIFYERCKQVVAALDEAEESLGQSAGTPMGVLRITLPDAFGRSHVLPLLGEYLLAWPGLQADVSLTDRVAGIVEEGFDLAVRIGVQAADSSLISRVVAKYDSVVCAAPSYIEARGDPKDAEELATHDCLIFSNRSGRQPWRRRQDDGTWIRIGGRGRLRLDSGEAIRDAAVAGLGIAYHQAF